MTDMKDLLPQIRTVVARYLDGEQPFDEAARALATILRPTISDQRKTAAAWSQPSSGGAVRIKPLSVAEWINPGISRGPTIEAILLAPGRSRADEHKAVVLMIEATRLAATGSSGDAA